MQTSVSKSKLKFCRYILLGLTWIGPRDDVTCILLRNICRGSWEGFGRRGKGSDHGHNRVSEKNDDDTLLLLSRGTG